MNQQIILREDVTHLGHMGDLVSVKPGYARNFLLPRGLAVVANEKQKNRVLHEKRILEARISKLRQAAEEVKTKLEQTSLTITKAVGENDKLFGSVTAMEIEALLKGQGFSIERKQIHLEEHLKSTGVFEVPVKLHRDVTATIKVVVAGKR
ncbi:MAG: 50S ribosomal protein L9 [Myxococcales bacterium]|nr:50S ribosomal protein L9 [Myxococcales bacterium]